MPLRITGAVDAKFKGRLVVPGLPKPGPRNMPYGWLESYTAAAHRLMAPSSGHRFAAPANYGFAFTVPSPVLVPSLVSFHKRELRTVFAGRLAKRGPMLGGGLAAQ